MGVTKSKQFLGFSIYMNTYWTHQQPKVFMGISRYFFSPARRIPDTGYGVYPRPQAGFVISGGFNPFEKYASHWIISPTYGWKFKKKWNHHLVKTDSFLTRFNSETHEIRLRNLLATLQQNCIKEQKSGGVRGGWFLKVIPTFHVYVWCQLFFLLL